MKVTLIHKTTDISWKKIRISDHEYQVAAIIDDKSFRITTEIPESKLVPLDISGNILTVIDGIYRNKDTNEIYTGLVKSGAFVYGHEVPDFHSLNKDMIWTITTAATQELDRQLQDTKEQLQDANQKINTLENTVYKQQQLIDQLLKDVYAIKTSMN